jgi:Secretion system C-terminal sorting domain
MKMIFKIYTAAALLIATNAHAQTGNNVFSGAEAVNFSVVSLGTPGGQTWATDRSAAPGYFSAAMGAAYASASDAANVNGYVKKYGNEAFTFPVGTGIDLRTLSISAPSAATDAYAAAWISGDPSGNRDPTIPNAGAHSIASVMAPIVSVSSIGEWDWQAGTTMGNTGTGTGLMINVSIPDMSSFAVPLDLRLVGWDGTSWIDLSGSATASGNTENSTLSGTMVAGITAIGIGSIRFPLPLRLEQFTGVAKNCTAELNWKTSQETNTFKFSIEQSLNGIVFNTVASVNAAGNNPDPGIYSSIISQPVRTAYYRLKMIDIDRAFTYSAVVRVQTACGIEDFMTLYPNPADGSAKLNLSFRTSYSGKANLVITNTSGQVLKQESFQVVSGNNTVPINVENFVHATYFVSLTREDGEKIGATQKIIQLRRVK